MPDSFANRDYKQEYEQLKAEKLLETVKKTQERLSKIQVQGPGTTVELSSLVTQVNLIIKSTQSILVYEIRFCIFLTDTEQRKR